MLKKTNITSTLLYFEQNTRFLKKLYAIHEKTRATFGFPPLSGMKSAAKLFKGPHFGNLKRIYLFGRVAMLAATDNERTFSLYKEVETDRRCNLDEGILNSFLDDDCQQWSHLQRVPA